MKVKDEYIYLENYIRECMGKFASYNWADDNTIEFFSDKKKKDKVGSLKLDDKEMDVYGEEVTTFVQSLLDRKKRLEALKLTEEKARTSLIENLWGLREQLRGLDENTYLLDKIEKEFSIIGVNKILYKRNMNGDNIFNERGFTLFLDCNTESTYSRPDEDGYPERLKDFLHKTFKPDVPKSSFNPKTYNNKPDKLQAKEEIVPIKIDGFEVGNYFKERNTISIYFDPFCVKKVLPLTEEIPEHFIKVIDAIREVSPKIVKLGDVRKKLFVSSFLKNVKNKVKEAESKMKEITSNIKSYEDSLSLQIAELHMKNTEIDMLNAMMERNGDGIFDEVDRAKNLPFLTDLEINGGSLNYVFKETTITAPNFSRNSSKYGTKYGKRTMYLGKVNIKVSPGGFNVGNTIKIDTNNHSHPHSSGNPGSPCFGGGEGSSKIYHLLATSQFADLGRMLWFWVKTYKNEGAYVKENQMYDYLLANGYPIWDENGERVKLNDPKRIETGEQIELDKGELYDMNIKKFKDFKLEG